MTDANQQYVNMYVDDGETAGAPASIQAPLDSDGLIESNWEYVCENFDEMGLKENLLRGIYASGFEKPSAIQQRYSVHQKT
ncbi:hypothetical protein QQG55_54740 [Brugia pahangi]